MFDNYETEIKKCEEAGFYSDEDEIKIKREQEQLLKSFGNKNGNY